MGGSEGSAVDAQRSFTRLTPRKWQPQSRHSMRGAGTPSRGTSFREVGLLAIPSPHPPPPLPQALRGMLLPCCPPTKPESSVLSYSFPSPHPHYHPPHLQKQYNHAQNFSLLPPYFFPLSYSKTCVKFIFKCTCIKIGFWWKCRWKSTPR